MCVPGKVETRVVNLATARRTRRGFEPDGVHANGFVDEVSHAVEFTTRATNEELDAANDDDDASAANKWRLDARCAHEWNPETTRVRRRVGVRARRETRARDGATTTWCVAASFADAGRNRKRGGGRREWRRTDPIPRSNETKETRRCRSWRFASERDPVGIRSEPSWSFENEFRNGRGETDAARVASSRIRARAKRRTKVKWRLLGAQPRSHSTRLAPLAVTVHLPRRAPRRASPPSRRRAWISRRRRLEHVGRVANRGDGAGGI